MHTPSPIGSGRPCNSQPRKALSFPAAPVPDPQNEILSPRHLLLSDPSWGLAGLDAPEPNPVKALWTGWPPGKDAQEQQMSSPPSFAPTFRLSCAHPPFSHDSSSRDQAFDGPLQRRRARAPPPRRPLSKAIPSPCTIWDPIWSNVGVRVFARFTVSQSTSRNLTADTLTCLVHRARILHPTMAPSIEPWQSTTTAPVLTLSPRSKLEVLCKPLGSLPRP